MRSLLVGRGPPFLPSCSVQAPGEAQDGRLGVAKPLPIAPAGPSPSQAPGRPVGPLPLVFWVSSELAPTTCRSQELSLCRALCRPGLVAAPGRKPGLAGRPAPP